MTKREMIALGWARLEALRVEHGAGVHASMVSSWGVSFARDYGAPCPWQMAINIGAMSEERWAQGIELCRAAHSVTWASPWRSHGECRASSRPSLARSCK